MAAKRKRSRRSRTEDPLAAYRRIRKPMPPPDVVFEDRRRREAEREAEREIREATPEARREDRGDDE
jgi:hypothetical protein